MSEAPKEKPKNPFKEIAQPFIDLIHAPRALWGINLAYLLEGMVYFGMLGYLAMHFSDFIFGGMEGADVYSHNMVMVLTAGITIAMFFLGFVADKYGVRRALLAAFTIMLGGRILISAAPLVFSPDGLWSPLHLMTMGGILLVVVGYGMYQPAAYAGVRKYTSPQAAAMGFAMLYALMNLGGYIPSFAFLLRDDDYLGLGIQGVFWVYTTFTLVALLATFLILTKKTEAAAIAHAKASREKEAEGKDEEAKEKLKDAEKKKAEERGFFEKLIHWVTHHPLTDLKFSFFIFALIPVQTLFTYNWFILPQYVNRAYTGWVGEYFELAANFNPLLIFIFVPIVTALTYKRRVYNMMIWGTFIMATPAFLLALGTNWMLLLGYLVIMTVGEAMWQPRFLQFAAQIAPEGRTGEYMGVAQLPWFLTKMLVPLIYSGRMMEHFCPAEGTRDPETMWFWFACIAMISPLLLLVFKPWAGKDFKESA